ncbi:MAG: hypothetical protein JW782_00550 [Candidatus Saganbacteria bacterium]|nr:hypothetical protein [Candidatus Saganbacteria bacterium]
MRMLTGFLVALMVISCALPAFGAGIRVAPGAFCMQDAQPGDDVDLGIDLVVYNDSPEEVEFTLNPIRASRAKRTWLHGYADIPNPEWLYFSKDKIKVAAYGEGRTRIHLNIPDNEMYYNQHWMVYVNVAGAPKNSQLFNIAIKPNYMIETKAKADTEAEPYGKLGLVPSVLNADEAGQGREEKVTFTVFNRDKIARTFKISSYIPQGSEQKQDINVTPGYEWIGKEDWIKPAVTEIEVLPREKAAVELKVKLPYNAATEAKGWEGIVMVEPSEGLLNFVRVRINK